MLKESKKELGHSEKEILKQNPHLTEQEAKDVYSRLSFRAIEERVKKGEAFWWKLHDEKTGKVVRDQIIEKATGKVLFEDTQEATNWERKEEADDVLKHAILKDH